MVDLGVRLKMLRNTKKITQVELANSLGLTKSIISAYENGSRYPSFSILIKIAVYFGVTTDFMLGVDMKSTISLSGLSKDNMEIVLRLINALREKQ